MIILYNYIGNIWGNRHKIGVGMKQRLSKAFSLAEMMVVMLLLSLVLAASVPIMTRQHENPTTGGSVPSGVINAYAGATPPTGWLLCDGSAVSRTTYAKLFSAIGTTYGSGNGSTTFNLPDLRGRIMVGLDNLGGTSANRITASEADTLGGSGGEEMHTLNIAEMPMHSHAGTTDSQGNHQHFTGLNQEPGHGRYGMQSAAWSSWRHEHIHDAGYDTYTNSTGAHVHNITTISQGNDTPHNNLQPYMAISYIIKG